MKGKNRVWQSFACNFSIFNLLQQTIFYISLVIRRRRRRRRCRCRRRNHVRRRENSARIHCRQSDSHTHAHTCVQQINVMDSSYKIRTYVDVFLYEVVGSRLVRTFVTFSVDNFSPVHASDADNYHDECQTHTRTRAHIQRESELLYPSSAHTCTSPHLASRKTKNPANECNNNNRISAGKKYRPFE